jgi:hypothetical protein
MLLGNWALGEALAMSGDRATAISMRPGRHFPSYRLFLGVFLVLVKHGRR